MKESLYLFNPFRIDKATILELAETYENLTKEIIDDATNMYDLAKNIEIYSNMNYIVGEIVARYTEEYDTLKTDIEIGRDNKIAELREIYIIKGEKAPAMKYFESKATEVLVEDLRELNGVNKRLRRFKNCYISIENKMNAIKKKMDAVKYEEFNK